MNPLKKGVREHFPNAASTIGAFQTEMFSDPFLLKPANLNLPDL